jgi:hypothetical protein
MCVLILDLCDAHVLNHDLDQYRDLRYTICRAETDPA